MSDNSLAYRRKKPRRTNRQAVVAILCICLLAGFVIGAIAGVDGYTEVSRNLNAYLRGFRNITEPMDVFRESVLKYGKLFVFIWLLAFLPSGGVMPIGGLAAALLILFRGVTYGFSTSVLICAYGAAGGICAAILYLPQSLLLIPAYIFTAYHCIQYIQKTGEIRMYLPVLGLGFAASLIAGFIDAFIIPGLVGRLL